MNIQSERINENQPLLAGNRNNDNIRLNIYDIESDGESADEPNPVVNKNEDYSCTLTIDTNLDKSENENVLNSARPSFTSTFPSPFEEESVLKFYGGPTSDELCVPSGEYEIDREKFIDKINGNNEGKNDKKKTNKQTNRIPILDYIFLFLHMEIIY